MLLVAALSGGVATGGASVQGQDGGAREATIAVNGIRLHYRIVGSGPPLLMLHGFTGIGADWAPYLPSLAKTAASRCAQSRDYRRC